MKKTAWLFVTAAAVIWGTMGIWVRGLNACGLQSMDIVAWRSIGTAVCSGTGLFLYNKKLLTIRIKDLWCFLGTGIASILFFNYCYFKSIEMIDLSTAAVLLYTSPVFVVLISAVCFGEKITWQKLAAVCLAVVGCAMVSGGGSAGLLNAAGILTGLGAGLGYALYSIFSRFALQKGYHTLTITFYTFLVAAVGILPYVPFSGLRPALFGEADFWGMSAGLILVVTVAAYVLYTYGLSGMENGKAAVIATIEPVTASLIGVLFYHETISLTGLCGIAAVLVSGWLVSRK